MTSIEDQLRAALRSRAESTDLSPNSGPPTFDASGQQRRYRRVAITMSLVIAGALIGGLIALPILRSRDDRPPAASRSVPAQTTQTLDPTPSSTWLSSGVANPTTVADSRGAASTTAAGSVEKPGQVNGGVDLMIGWPQPPQDVFPNVERVPMLLPAIPVLSASSAARVEGADDPTTLPRYLATWFGHDASSALVITTYPGRRSTVPTSSREAAGPIGAWDESFLSTNTSGMVALSLNEPSGSVEIWARGLSREQVVNIGASLERLPSGQPGWDIGASGSDLTLIHEGWAAGAASRSIRWFADGPVGELSIVSGVPDLFTSSWVADAPSIVDVHGVAALAADQGGRSAVIWSPQPNIIVRLGIYGDLVHALAIARSVQVVDAAQWESASQPGHPTDDCSMFC